MSRLERQLVDCLRDCLLGRRSGVPEAGRLVWRWFGDLCRTRTGNGHGPNPIALAEIEAYGRLYRWPIEPRHVDLILALDRVWLDHARRNIGGGTQRSAPTGPGQDCTPEAFDAVFG